MLLFNRILFNKSSVLTDLSQNLNDSLIGSEVIAYQVGDAIYLGSDYPFNHRYFDIKVANDQPSTLKVQLFNGGQWVDAAEVIDTTRSGGVSIAKSGVIAWVPDRTKAWTRTFDTKELIPELASVRLYDLYWAKLTFSANLKATTEISYVGHRFVNDNELIARYPELADSTLIGSYATGKTDWKDQCILASEETLKDLINREVITSVNQVLDWRIFNTPAIHKAAEIIYAGLGTAYVDKKKAAYVDFKIAGNLKIYNVDENDNAILDFDDKTNRTGWATR